GEWIGEQTCPGNTPDCLAYSIPQMPTLGARRATIAESSKWRPQRQESARERRWPQNARASASTPARRKAQPGEERGLQKNAWGAMTTASNRRRAVLLPSWRAPMRCRLPTDLGRGIAVR